MIDLRTSVTAVALLGVTVSSVLAAVARAPAAGDEIRPVSAAAAGASGPVRRDVPTDLPPPAAPSTVPAERYGPVSTSRASIRIPGIGDPGTLRRARATAGVAVATTIRVAEVPIGTTPGSTVRIAAVDPPAFRALTPQPTADTVGVWERLDDGEAAFTHERAHGHGLELGGYVELGGSSIRVGALASNGTPPVADAVVDRSTGSRLGIDDVAPTILVGVEPEAVVEEVAERLRAATGATVEVVPEPRAPAPVSAEQQRGAATVWDALAMCESSGDWHIDTGNGFYGGLQFLPESWWMVGGTGMPHEASREEQIHRAELLLRIQGWEAWPVCSVRLGLRPPPPDQGTG